MRVVMMSGILLLAVLALPAAAQETKAHEDDRVMHHTAPPTEGLRAELIQDVDGLEQKYMGLARAMAGSFGWRPAEGVRSVGEVFGHVADANFAIPSFAGLEREMADRQLEGEEEEAAVLEGLEHSFSHARHSIAAIPDAELEDRVEMFGQDVTKRQVLSLLVSHMHEHLGQAIAYARMNGITPPWSR